MAAPARARTGDIPAGPAGRRAGPKKGGRSGEGPPQAHLEQRGGARCPGEESSVARKHDRLEVRAQGVTARPVLGEREGVENEGEPRGDSSTARLQSTSESGPGAEQERQSPGVPRNGYGPGGGSGLLGIRGRPHGAARRRAWSRPRPGLGLSSSSPADQKSLHGPSGRGGPVDRWLRCCFFEPLLAALAASAAPGPPPPPPLAAAGALALRVDLFVWGGFGPVLPRDPALVDVPALAARLGP